MKESAEIVIIVGILTVTILGVVGNIGCLYLLTKKIFAPGITVSLCFLLGTETVLLIVVSPRVLLEPSGIFSALTCKLYVAFNLLCVVAINWALVLITLIRFLYVKFPITAPSICSPRRTVVAIVLLLIFSSLLVIYNWNHENIDEMDMHDDCIHEVFLRRDDKLHVVVVNTLLIGVFPAVILLVFNVIIAKEMAKFLKTDQDRMVDFMKRSRAISNIFMKMQSKQSRLEQELPKTSTASTASASHADEETARQTSVDPEVILPASDHQKKSFRPTSVRSGNTPRASDHSKKLSRDTKTSPSLRLKLSTDYHKMSRRMTSGLGLPLATEDVDKNTSNNAPENEESDTVSTSSSGMTFQQALEEFVKAKEFDSMVEQEPTFNRFVVKKLPAFVCLNFIICHLPITLWYFGHRHWFGESEEDLDIERKCMRLGELFLYSHCATDFLMYCAAASRFRAVFSKVCLRRCRKR